MIKWLIILFALCLGIILIILILTKQNIEINSLSQKDASTTEQIANYSQPLTSTTTLAPSPLVKSGITIIKKPAVEPEKKILLPEIASSENISPNSTAEGNSQAGITKIGKQPSPKESQEMNSKGIVMY